MKLLRHKITGNEGMYPAHFAEFDYFEEVVSLEEPHVPRTVKAPEKERKTKKDEGVTKSE